MVKNSFQKISQCRSCGSEELIPVLSLGDQYTSDFLNSKDELNGNEKIPLDLVLCGEQSCSLLQTLHTASRQTLFNKNYWFRSSVNESLVEGLYDITSAIQKKINISDDDLILDIGCNDGTLLRSFKKGKKVGFEPAPNIAPDATKGTFKIINDFFNYESFENELPGLKCKSITSIAMFYDLENPNKFVADISKCLDKNGIWTIQMAYLKTDIDSNGFDNIVHEHLEYYSLHSLESLLSRHNLEVFDLELNDLYGGSIRTYIKHKECSEFSIQESVEQLRAQELADGFSNVQTYLDYGARVMNLKNQLLAFIKQEQEAGKIIYCYGASTKGNTQLQYFDLNDSVIEKVVDRDHRKFGKYTVGSNLLVISEEEGRQEKPDYFIILPWHLTDFFVERERAYLEKGGKFIVPIPHFRVISIDDLEEKNNEGY
jgi:NDP-4-keto-2,6-dideoxyhexose 3-C-methyltransferase